MLTFHCPIVVILSLLMTLLCGRERDGKAFSIDKCVCQLLGCAKNGGDLLSNVNDVNVR